MFKMLRMFKEVPLGQEITEMKEFNLIINN
jgi:hypothetical protein